jgi:flagellar hook-length control protein FliK
MQSVIRVAVRGGTSTARIILSPAALGQVEIRLRYSADGVTATVIADRPEAAQALSQSVGELRRALESQGVSILSLDVSQSGPEEQRGTQRETPDRPEQRQNPQLASPETPDEISIDASQLPDAGSRLDVLA